MLTELAGLLDRGQLRIERVKQAARVDDLISRRLEARAHNSVVMLFFNFAQACEQVLYLSRLERLQLLLVGFSARIQIVKARAHNLINLALHRRELLLEARVDQLLHLLNGLREIFRVLQLIMLVRRRELVDLLHYAINLGLNLLHVAVLAVDAGRLPAYVVRSTLS